MSTALPPLLRPPLLRPLLLCRLLLCRLLLCRLLLLAGLAGCFTPTHPEATWAEAAYDQTQRAWPDAPPDRLPEALDARLGERIDVLRGPGRDVQPGDVLVYRLDRVLSGHHQADYLWLEATGYRGLTVSHGDRAMTARASANLTITLTSDDGSRHQFESESELLETELVVYGEDGTERSRSEPQLLIDLMAEGFVEDIETLDSSEEPSEAELEQVGRAMMRQVYLAQVLGEDPTVFDIALELAGGWLFALDRLFTGSLEVSLDARTQEARAITWDGLGGIEGYRFPLEVGISDKPAIRSVVTCVAPAGALQMTAGVVAASGFRASKVDARYRLSLVAIGRRAGGDAAEPAPTAVRIDRIPRRFPVRVLAFEDALPSAPLAAHPSCGAAGEGPSDLR